MSPDRYHHGDLPNALRRAAVEVIAEDGLGRFSLREVARRAGVSHTAPAHHFGDVRGLLTSVATEGFEQLYAVTSTAAAAHDEPADRLEAMAEAYVQLAIDSPAHCEVMFRTDVVDTDDPALVEAGLRSYQEVHDAVDRLIAAERLDADVDVAVELCWTTMQGLVVLDQKLRRIDEAKGNPVADTVDRIRRLCAMMLDGVRHSGAA